MHEVIMQQLHERLTERNATIYKERMQEIKESADSPRLLRSRMQTVRLVFAPSPVLQEKAGLIGLLRQLDPTRCVDGRLTGATGRSCGDCSNWPDPMQLDIALGGYMALSATDAVVKLRDYPLPVRDAR